MPTQDDHVRAIRDINVMRERCAYASRMYGFPISVEQIDDETIKICINGEVLIGKLSPSKTTETITPHWILYEDEG